MSAIQQSAVTQITSPGNSNYDPYYSNVSLLLAMNGSNTSTSFVDASPNQKTVTANGNAQISTTQSKFGGSSAVFDGTTDFLSTATLGDFNIFSSDFTVEFFVYFSGATNNQCLFQIGFNNTNRANIGLVSGAIQLFTTNGGVGGTQITATAPAVNTWHHVAWVKSGTTTRLFVNGTSVGTPATSVSYPSGSMSVGIGADQINSGATCLLGYIDDLRITSGIARYTSNFTVPAYANPLTGPQYDPFYNNVSLLLHCNGSNASTNFIDNSGSPKTVTANGNAQISTAQWRFGGSSAYFDGTGDSLSCTSSDLILTADFTVEFWIYPNSVAYAEILKLGTESSGRYLFFVDTGNIKTNLFGSPSQPIYGTLSTNTWTHLAFVRSGTTIRAYINGVVSGVTDTQAGTLGNTGLTVIGSQLNGYIDDLRISKGVARYTTNFTPPRLAYADSGPNFDPYYDQTVLLLPMNGANASTSFIDSSRTAKAITVNGNTQLSTTQSKFGGSSAYFDGTGDWLTNTNTDFQFPGNFTIEAWIYPTNVTGGFNLFAFGTDTTGRYVFYINNGSLIGNYFGASNTTFGGTITINTWTHLAFVRNSSTITAYVNGVSLATTETNSNTLGNSGQLNIGASALGGSTYIGYMDDLRITKGIARYTSNFTLPVRPNPTTGIQYDNYYDNVSLLLHMNGPNNGTSFVDNSLRAKTVTRNGNSVTSTTQYKWGVSSAYFDGTGDYLQVSNSDDFYFGVGDFTIEFWFFPTSVTLQAIIWDQRPLGIQTTQPTIYHSSAGGASTLYYYTNAANRITGPTLSINTWYHIAVARASGITQMFVNGTRVGSQYIDSTNYDSASTGIRIGSDQFDSAGGGVTGYIDDVRITKGIARYTANFTPPTQAFPDQGPRTDPFYYNTSLLLHFDGTNTSTNFVDNSPVIKSVTPSGNAQISTAQSKFGGSSALFNGTGDFLTIPNSSAFDLTTSFTLELWVYQTARTAVTGVFCSMGWINGVTAGSNFGVNDSGIAGFNLMLASNPNTSDEISGGFVPLNTWTHIACVRNGSTLMIFINGIQTALASAGTTLAPNPATPVTIGRYSSNFIYPFNGYIDDFRFTKGVARYAPFNSNVSLLLPMNGANGSTTFTDNSPVPKTITRNGNAQISTAQSKFGGSSLFLDGTGDWLYAAVGSAPFGTGDFTIEGWFYWTNVVNSGLFHVYPGTPPGSLNGTAVGTDGITFGMYVGGVGYSQGGSISVNTWYHVAYVRASGSVSLYVNGVQQGASRADTTNYGNGNGLNIGLYYSSGFTFPGYIDDVRVTRGTARYTSNFTPPTEPFPNNVLGFTPPQRPFPDQ